MVELSKKERKALTQKKWRAKRKDREKLWLPVYRRYTEEEKKEIKKLRTEGCTLKEIAIKFNWSISTIWKICKNVEKITFFSEELKEVDKIIKG